MDIPVISPDGRLLTCVSEQEARLIGNARMVFNRRGHIKRVLMNGALNLRPLWQGTCGTAFEQPVTTGHVWALRGVEGSY